MGSVSLHFGPTGAELPFCRSQLVRYTVNYLRVVYSLCVPPSRSQGKRYKPLKPNLTFAEPNAAYFSKSAIKKRAQSGYS